ncbi:MAG: CpXC domain-containing protein [Elusimicrobiales bacterium]|nr:CpXC domain-containing protein [Elusimicrobiales bacterium]
MPSIHADVCAKCPSCGEEFDAQAWSFVRGDENDDLRLALLYGEFNLLRCEKCSAFFHHEMPVVYFDPPTELLVFILPSSCEAERGKWTAKMNEDFKALEKGLFREMKIDSVPLVFFGAEAVRGLLEAEQDMNDESDVIAAVAGEAGFKLKKMRPSYAREHSLPLYIPFAGDNCDRESVLKAAGQMLEGRCELARLEALRKLLSDKKTVFPPLV